MKLTTTNAVIALLCSSVFAAPQWKEVSAEHKPKDHLSEFKEKFTSVWKIVGTPDQVVLANGTAAPGQLTSIGYYNFGINSETDTICWVRANISLLFPT